MKALILSVFLVVCSLFQGAHTTLPSFMQGASDVYAHPRLLVVGDGLSVGYDATDVQHGYVSLLARSLHARLTMRAAGGLLTPALYDALQDDPPAQADIIVVELGTNDGGKDYWSFLQAYPAVLAMLRRISPNAILICSGPWQPHVRTQDGDNVYIQNFCNAQGGMFVDLQHLYTNPAYHWTTTDHWLGWLSTYTDQFLPNNAGMAAICSAFLAAIHSEIAQREGLPPSPPVVAIISASLGGFLITIAFALPVNGGRRKRRGQRGHHALDRRPVGGSWDASQEDQQGERIEWKESSQPEEAFTQKRASV